MDTAGSGVSAVDQKLSGGSFLSNLAGALPRLRYLLLTIWLLGVTPTPDLSRAEDRCDISWRILRDPDVRVELLDEDDAQDVFWIYDQDY